MSRIRKQPLQDFQRNEAAAHLKRARGIYANLMDYSYQGFPNALEAMNKLAELMTQGRLSWSKLDPTGQTTTDIAHENVKARTAFLLDRQANERMVRFKNKDIGKGIPNAAIVADDILHLLDESEKLLPLTRDEERTTRNKMKLTVMQYASAYMYRRALTCTQKPKQIAGHQRLAAAYFKKLTAFKQACNL